MKSTILIPIDFAGNWSEIKIYCDSKDNNYFNDLYYVILE